MVAPRFVHAGFYVVMYRDGDTWAPLYSPCRHCTHINLHTTRSGAEFEMEQAKPRGLEMEIVELIPAIALESMPQEISSAAEATPPPRGSN